MVFDDFKSEFFDIKEGIDQGDTQSLIAWIIYNHKILKIFKKSCKETSFLFIDNAAILVTGKDFTDMHAKLKNVMTRTGRVIEWARMDNCTFGLEIFQLLDPTKRKVMDPDRPQKRIPQPRSNLLLHRQIIKSAMTFKFLGLHINRELKWKEQLAVAIGKGRDWLRQCNRLAKTTGGISGQQMRRLYLAVVKPRMLYGVDVFLGPALCNNSLKNKKGTQNALNKLAVIQQSVAIMIVGGLLEYVIPILSYCIIMSKWILTNSRMDIHNLFLYKY